MTWVCFTAC